MKKQSSRPPAVSCIAWLDVTGSSTTGLVHIGVARPVRAPSRLSGASKLWFWLTRPAEEQSPWRDLLRAREDALAAGISPWRFRRALVAEMCIAGGLYFGATFLLSASVVWLRARLRPLLLPIIPTRHVPYLVHRERKEFLARRLPEYFARVARSNRLDRATSVWLRERAAARPRSASEAPQGSSEFLAWLRADLPGSASNETELSHRWRRRALASVFYFLISPLQFSKRPAVGSSDWLGLHGVA